MLLLLADSTRRLPQRVLHTIFLPKLGQFGLGIFCQDSAESQNHLIKTVVVPHNAMILCHGTLLITCIVN